ncbi:MULTISPECIES: hypothetical protein [Kitasatospora]|uniref:Uncharacterized protein n=1 Tax=Kitasatospora setae (strain ATCC 33774 / DSM 43861 / JCM 3304 / KCC A-0304 / NBRC 14216 / KM-6054) TaxID=452652 RepID=E4N5K3_KITSK|nr:MULTISPECIES: hypothetical protein [Kitasatospora]BAJ26484.1 hypothetical protein KSE_06440 [Kitasatospora setae KM-6054]
MINEPRRPQGGQQAATPPRVPEPAEPHGRPAGPHQLGHHASGHHPSGHQAHGSQQHGSQPHGPQAHGHQPGGHQLGGHPSHGPQSLGHQAAAQLLGLREVMLPAAVVAAADLLLGDALGSDDPVTREAAAATRGRLRAALGLG